MANLDGMNVTSCTWNPVNVTLKIPIQRDHKSMNIKKSQSELATPISFSSNKMLHSCSSPLNYSYKMLTAYAHRMPTLIITKIIIIQEIMCLRLFKMVINMNFFCTLTLQHISLALFFSECHNRFVIDLTTWQKTRQEVFLFIL
jgi:hypothetical protein